jgi:hypothetical protein
VTMTRTTGRHRDRRIAVGVLVIALLILLSLASGCSWFKKEKKVSKTHPVAQTTKVVTCPLCGSVVDDPTTIKRWPVAVKVENDPKARPQSGLDKACIVYEETTEGGITRFMPIYLCREADQVGPVRSARPADVDLVYPYYALFAHCGGGLPTLRMIKQAGIADLDELTWAGAYWRTHDRRAPHNLYSSTQRLRAAGGTAYPFQGEVGSPFEFLSTSGVKNMERDRQREQRRAQEEAQQSAANQYQPLITVVSQVVIPYASVCAVRYSYDPTTGRFLRFVAGAPHTDRTTGRQLAADTVIVQYVTEGSSGMRDVRGAETPLLGIVGTGRAQVFILGQMIDANWVKSSREEHTRYLDNSGKEIRIKPGSTWIELVPANKQVTFS